MHMARTLPVLIAALMLTVALPTVAAADDPDPEPPEIEWCEYVTEDLTGSPAIVPYPCLKENTAADEPIEVEWCEGHTEDPFGQPQVYRYPCKVHTDTSEEFPPEIEWCTDDDEVAGIGFAYMYPCLEQPQDDEDPVNVEFCIKYGHESKTGIHYIYPYPCTVDVNL